MPLRAGNHPGYLGKISGPLPDRIDIHIEVPPVAYKELRGKDDGLNSGEIRERVVSVRAIQHSRAAASQTLRA